MHRFGLILALISAALLANCTTKTRSDTDAQINAVRYQAPGPAKIGLVTSINSKNGSGAHSALVISGRERVVFDPAGSWHNPGVAERSDVLYGMNDAKLGGYFAFQGNYPFYMVYQELDVTPEIAAKAQAWAEAQPDAIQATCALNVSQLLRHLGFTQVNQSYFPKNISRDFQNVPGVRTRLVFDQVPEEPYEQVKFDPRPAS